MGMSLSSVRREISPFTVNWPQHHAGGVLGQNCMETYRLNGLLALLPLPPRQMGSAVNVKVCDSFSAIWPLWWQTNSAQLKPASTDPTQNGGVQVTRCGRVQSPVFNSRSQSSIESMEFCTCRR